VYSDFGRILNPLILVHYDENDVPYTKLTPENVEHILSGKSRIEWLLEQQIIEYISVEEAHNCLIAENPATFLRQLDPEVIKNKQQRSRYTHILIPQSLIGIVALLSPFGNHAQTKRITMFTNQAK
jgi:DNA-directed RNA polymerase beta subunit